MNNKTLILIPTYNESENVKNLCKKIINLRLDLDILFIDDNSPDGTGEILDELKRKYSNVYVIHRSAKLGIGSAHQEGIKWAYDNNYTLLITMDCDFTHKPENILQIINSANSYDIVVGSRYLDKYSLEDWNIHRKILTILGHFMTKYLLKIKFDATGAFRLYKLNKIPEKLFELVISPGYSFFYESLYILNLNNFKIKETPIKLPPRTYGHSKMKFKDIWHSFTFLFFLYIATTFRKQKYLVNIEKQESKIIPRNDEEEWDAYWDKKWGNSGALYGHVASFYRKFIIKPSLNYFIKKHFKQGAEVLHAGCGSGQVDTDIRSYISITALDVSSKALEMYKKTNKNSCKLLQSSIFNISLPDSSMDGIYNLGVMEHFSESEIGKILAEFHRVLKPDGKIILFWPPDFGLSVTFLKIIRKIIKLFLRKNIKFHPDEITRVKSKEQINKILNLGNFSIIYYYFGIRDLFTHSIIVAEKIH